MPLHGNLLDLFIVFGAGVMVSFTPCVYPVMPLTASCIAAANVNHSRLRGFVLSLVFVLGMAMMYSVLAVLASLTGKIFGHLQNQPLMYGVISGLLFFFALVMFDVFTLPYFGARIQSKVRPHNMGTVFLFGIVSGLVVGSCTAPALGALLAYIGTKQNLWYGILLMFSFSYGVGFSLILVGTFSGLLSSLPRSGSWMIWIKRICGGMILLAAGYFLLLALGVF